MATQSKRRVEGSALVPSEEVLQTKAVATRLRYWCGALKSAPREVVYIAGVDFPKLTEKVSKNPADPSRTQRIPQAGMIHELTVAQVEAIQSRLPHMVARFHLGKDGESRHGKIIRIRSEKELEEYRQAKLPLPIYEPEAGDEPLADHVFMVLCEDQENGQPGTVYPEPLSHTGLEIPGDDEQQPARRGPGRPKGSKNKPKAEPAPIAPTEEN
jgi:hypothetical protein